MREGASIGPYRVVRRIGEGGMGAVFLGEHTLIGRYAAIKVLLPELSAKRESVDRFFNEARATTAISDPGIVQVFDFGFTADNTAYIVMELLEGEQLNQRIERLGALTPSDALRITRQVAGSLGAAHAVGIVHRDLKPENLYMIRDPEAPGGERPKILDFGIAKLGPCPRPGPELSPVAGRRTLRVVSADAIADRRRTRTGAVLGTPVYMSPEQCSGAATVDHRADIYSLGCVLFHLLTGQPPFDLPGIGEIISAHLREPAPAPSSIVPLPAEIDELMRRCLAKSPEDRFATMLELQLACDAILARITLSGAATLAMPSGSMRIAAARTLDPAPRTTLSTSAGQPSVVLPRRRLGVWLMLAALAGGSGSAIAYFTTRPSARHAVAEPPGSLAAGTTDGSARVATTDAGAVEGVAPAAPATATVPAISIDAAADPSAGSEAPAVKSATPPRAVAPPKRPVVGKPPLKAKPQKPRTEDLYDDRN